MTDLRRPEALAPVELLPREQPHAAVTARYHWRSAARDCVDALVIGTLMIAAAVFAVVGLMMLDGFEPPGWLVAYAALVGGCYACLRMGGAVIGRHIRWRQ